jgi:hypothetical protein
MTDLSPIAQAVSNAAEAAQCAYWDTIDKGVEDEDSALEFQMIAAAALRAASKSLQSDPSSSSPLGMLLACQDQIYAIADELEGPNG